MEHKRVYLYAIVAMVLISTIGVAWYMQNHRARVAQNPSAASSTEQQIDLSIGPHPEQPSATPVPPAVPSAPITSPAPLTPGCDLHFSFAPASKSVEPGGSVQYTATVSNQGTDTCTNVSFSVYYASDETFVSASPAPSSSNYYWKIGDLPSRGSSSVAITTTASALPSDTEIDNEACATADNSADVCPDNAIFIGNAPSTPTPTISTATAPSTASAPSGGIWGAAFDTREFGIWIWETPFQMTPDYASSALNAAATNGFNTVYVTIDDYVAIAALPDGADKSAKQAAYFQAVENFVSAAHIRGIAVYVEGGSRDWAESANRWKGYALIDFVQAYNRAYPGEEVKGLQYDVESYLLPSYTTDQVGTLTNFLAFIDEAARRMESENPTAHLSVVIPHFYDSVQNWTPLISFDGSSSYTYTHLLQILQQDPNSTVIVMAYRNSFAGNNGTEQLAGAEVAQATNGGYSTKVIVAQETGAVDPAYVTFHGLSKSDLYNALNQISSTFGQYSSYGGMAVDYLDPFLALR